MKESHRLMLIKTLSFTAVLTYTYIIFSAIKLLIVNPINIAFPIVLISGLAGYIWAVFMYGGKRVRCSKACVFLTCPVLSVLYLLLGKYQGILDGAFEAVLILISFIIGIRAHFTDHYNVLARSKIYFGTGVYAVFLTVIPFIEAFNQLTTTGIVLASIFSIICFSILNQKTLDYNISLKRGVDSYGTQKKLRSYNIKLVLIICLIIAFLINLREIVARIITLFMKMAVYAIGGVFYIIGLLFPQSSQTGEESGTDNIGEMMPPGESNSTVDIILTIVFGILFIYLAYKLLPKLLKSIARFFKSLGIKISNLFYKLFRAERQTDFQDTGEYMDEIEIVKLQKPAVVKNIPSHKRYKKQLRKIKDPVKRIRFIYAMALEKLAEASIKIKPSDTTGEISARLKCRNEIENEFQSLTAIYDGVRYGQIIPTGEQEQTALNKYESIFSKLKAY